MSKYRINVRFDTDDPKQAEAVKFLQSLEHSRNAFIVSAVLDAVPGKSAVNNILRRRYCCSSPVPPQP